MAISDAEYQEWLEEDGVTRVLLVEAKYWDGSEGTEYMSDVGHITKPTDTPANQEYEDLIGSFPVFRRAIAEAFTGKTQQSYGDIEIDNSNGERDDWLDRSWNGRDLVLKFGDPSWDYDDFRTVMKGTTAELTAKGLDTLVLKIRDKGAFLEKNAERIYFITGPNVDKPEPICYGEVYKIAPILEDGATHLYRWDESDAQAVPRNVYDQGVIVSETLVLPEKASFTLSSQPAGLITADTLGKFLLDKVGDELTVEAITKWSEDFTNVLWLKNNVTLVPNTILAPDNSITGTLVYPSSSGTDRGISQGSIGVGDLNSSIFVKYAGVEWVRLVNPYTTIGGECWFNIRTGVIGTNTVPIAGNQIIEINDWGDNWWRISIPQNNPVASVNRELALYLADDDNSTTVTLNGSAGVYIWGGNLSIITHPLNNVSQYIKTEAINVISFVSVYRDDIATIIWDLLKKSDLTSEDISIPSLLSFQLKHQQSIGFYITDEIKLSNALDTLLSSVGSFWGFDRTGQFTVGQLVDPTTYDPSLTITSDDIVEGGMSIKAGGRQLPRYKVTLGYKKYWRTQTPAELAGSVSEDDRNDLGLEYREVIAEDPTVLTANPLAHESPFLPTLLADSTEAQAEADRRLALKDDIRTIYIVDCFATPFSIDVGDIILVDHDRFGFDGGVPATVVAYSESMTKGRIQLEIWK